MAKVHKTEDQKKKEAEKRAAAIEDALAKEVSDAWHKILQTHDGRLILWAILDKCKLFSFPFYGNSHDALHRGHQQIGSTLLNDHVFPHGMEFYTTMLLEAEERDKRLQAALDEYYAALEEKDNV